MDAQQSRAGDANAASETPQRRPTRSWIVRFTLRALLGLMVLSAVAFAYLAAIYRESWRQQQIAAGLAARGSNIHELRNPFPESLKGVMWTAWRKLADRPKGIQTLKPECWTVDELEQLSELSALDLRYSRPEELKKLNLRKFPQLTFLQFIGDESVDLHNPNLDAVPLLPVDLTPLSRLADLHGFSIECFTLDDAHLASIGNAKQFEYLHLRRCRLPDGWLERLPVMPHLKLLMAGRVRLTRADVASLARQPSLTHFSCDLDRELIPERNALMEAAQGLTIDPYGQCVYKR